MKKQLKMSHEIESQHVRRVQKRETHLTGVPMYSTRELKNVKEALFIQNIHTMSAKIDVETGEMHWRQESPVIDSQPPSSFLGRMKNSLSNTKLTSYFFDKQQNVRRYSKIETPPTSMAGNFTEMISTPSPKLGQKKAETFEVLGLELGYLTKEHQFLVCAGGVMIFLLLYGYLQEEIVIEVFDRRYGIFVSFLQFGGYTVFCYLQRLIKKADSRKVPLQYYFLLASMAAIIQVLTNLAMQTLNYPVKVLFKSSRIVPVMMVGVCYYRKKYSRRDYMVALMIVFGLTMFMQADSHVSPQFDFIGVLYIVVALFLDAINVNIQEDIMNKFQAPQDEFVLYTYAVSAVMMLVSSIWVGEFWEGLSFAHQKGIFVWIEILAYSGAGFFGVSCAAAITKKFGAFISSMTTTARKALTLCLSFFFFPKPVSSGHYIGGLIFGAGLVLKSWKSKNKKLKVEGSMVYQLKDAPTSMIHLSQSSPGRRKKSIVRI